MGCLDQVGILIYFNIVQLLLYNADKDLLSIILASQGLLVKILVTLEQRNELAPLLKGYNAILLWSSPCLGSIVMGLLIHN